MDYIFLTGIAVLVLAQTYFAARCKLNLTGKALLLVLALNVFAFLVSAPLLELAPRPSIHRTLVFYAIVLCAEDVARTWFVATRVQAGARLVTSALAFATTISLVETGLQFYGWIVAAAQSAGLMASPDEGPDPLFTSGFETFGLLALCSLKPVSHFALCVSLYYAWRIRYWAVYSAIVSAHIAFDVAVVELPDRVVGSFPATILAVNLLFTGVLCLAAFWLRVAANRCGGGDSPDTDRTTG